MKTTTIGSWGEGFVRKNSPKVSVTSARGTILPETAAAAPPQAPPQIASLPGFATTPDDAATYGYSTIINKNRKIKKAYIANRSNC